MNDSERDHISSHIRDLRNSINNIVGSVHDIREGLNQSNLNCLEKQGSTIIIDRIETYIDQVLNSTQGVLNNL